MNKAMAIVLAAGEGKRMKSDMPKVLHKIASFPVIDYVLQAVSAVDTEPVLVISNISGERVKEHVGARAKYALQSERLGTGHAVMMAREQIEKSDAAAVLIVAGDMPLLTRQTIISLCEPVQNGDVPAAMLTSIMQDGLEYGRVIRGEDGCVDCIIEHADATEEQRAIQEVNASVYCFEKQALLSCLAGLNNDNAQGEYYLTDCIGLLRKKGLRVSAHIAPAQECMGINDRVQLYEASRALQRRMAMDLIRSGVQIIDADSVYLDPTVRVGEGTVIYPGNTLQGDTVIGKDCILYPGSRIVDTTVSDGVSIQNSVIQEAQIGSGTTIGPYAYLRPGTVIGEKCRVGDFVEVKNSKIGNGSKVSHLTYVGDGEIGERCNMGCGVVFVNYDGKHKFRTVVQDDTFVGCNVNLVAPVTVGKGAYVAAGSTVTEDVPDDALCIARNRQTIKQAWAKKRREADT